MSQTTRLIKWQELRKNSISFRYAFSVLMPMIGFALQFAFQPLMGQTQYFLLFPTVFVVIIVAGFGPACLTAILCALGANYIFLEPAYTFKINEASITKFALFVTITMTISWFIHRGQLIQQRLSEQIKGEERFRLMADSAPVLIWISDVKKSCVWFNRGWLQWTGRTQDQEYDTGWTEGVHPEDLDRCLKVYTENFDARKEFYMEYRLRHHSGEYRWLSDNGVPRFRDGVFDGYIGACVDIHEQIKSRDAMATAIRSRDEFLSIASHELKTPLTSLKLQAQLLKNAIEKNDPKAYAKERIDLLSKQTEKQVRRLSRLIDDMLDVSRIRTGQLSIEKEEFQLIDLIKDTVERMAMFNEVGPPTIVCIGDTKGYWDRLRVEQAITNLLTNAIRYGDKKPITINITSDETDVTFSIVDQGIGIAKENQSKIFERFERGGVSASDISGLGLGLFITKQIILAHGGEIWVDSSLNRGSKFTVRLPRKHELKTLNEVGISVS